MKTNEDEMKTDPAADEIVSGLNQCIWSETFSHNFFIFLFYSHTTEVILQESS